MSAVEPPPVPPVARPVARHTARRVPGRTAAAVAVAAVLLGVGLVSRAVPPPAAAPPAPSPGGVAVSPADARSSSLFCVPGIAGADTVFLANTSGAPVRGVMTTVGTAGATPVRRPVIVPAGGTAAVDPATASAGVTATAFTFAGGGVTAEQSVGSAAGWGTAPCASQVSTQWSFAGGSTAHGDTLTLSLFNPTAAPAMVSAIFLTASGAVLTPQAYQGLTIGPGQVVEEQLGAFVQDQPTVATLVSSTSGSLVATELQQTTAGSATGLSLELGSPVPETTWHFAQTTAAVGAEVDFTLANPGSSPVTAEISVGLPSATVVPRQVVVPAMAATVFRASSVPGWPQRTAYTVTISAPAPIVVGRSVLAAASTPAPQWGASAGVSSSSPRWLVIGPGVPGAPAVAGATVRSLSVADPGGTAARVVVTRLGSVRPVARATVGPHSLSLFVPSELGGGTGPFTVQSSAPVVVEADASPSGAPGVVASNGAPLPVAPPS